MAINLSENSSTRYFERLFSRFAVESVKWSKKANAARSQSERARYTKKVVEYAAKMNAALEAAKLSSRRKRR